MEIKIQIHLSLINDSFDPNVYNLHWNSNLLDKSDENVVIIQTNQMKISSPHLPERQTGEKSCPLLELFIFRRSPNSG